MRVIVRSSVTRLWFSRISRQTDPGIDLKLSGYVNYGTIMSNWSRSAHFPPGR